MPFIANTPDIPHEITARHQYVRKGISGSDIPKPENFGHKIDGQARIGNLQERHMIVMVLGGAIEVIADKD